MTQATVEVLVSNLVVSEVEVDRVAVSVEETLTTSVIEVGIVGPQGPAGAADLNYTHVQALPSDVWVVNHNLGKYPSITVIDSSGEEVEGEARHVSPNQVIVTFSAGFSGTVHLN